jgi:5'-3' exonuclease
MGIRNFNRLLTLHCPTAHEPFNLSKIKNKKVGIDAFLFLYEIKLKMKCNQKTFRMNFYDKLNPIINQKPLDVIFCFDGKSPPEKSETIQKRKDEKEKLSKKFGPNYKQYIKINQSDIDNYKNLIKSTDSFSFVQCFDEAEAALVRMEKSNLLDFIFSSDTDIIALGSSYIYKKNFQWIYVNNETIKTKLKLTKEELLDMCILMGNDFNPSVYRVGPITSWQYIQKYKTLEKVFENNANIFSEKVQQRMYRSRELFSKELGNYCLHNQLYLPDDINTAFIPLRNNKFKKISNYTSKTRK